MQVIFYSREADAHELRSVAVNQVRAAIRRLTWLVTRASVQFSDVNGPRGGVDKRCQVHLRTARCGDVVITAQAHDWRCALNNALSRARRLLLRLWCRSRGGRGLDRRALAQDNG